MKTSWKIVKIHENPVKISWKSMKIHENSRKIMKMHENAWKSMKIHDNSWKFVKIRENSWKFMKSMKISWKIVKIHENPVKISWKSMKIHENSRKFMKMHENSWNSMKIHENSWKFMEIHETSANPIQIHENSWKFRKNPRKFAEIRERFSAQKKIPPAPPQFACRAPPTKNAGKALRGWDRFPSGIPEGNRGGWWGLVIRFDLLWKVLSPKGEQRCSPFGGLIFPKKIESDDLRPRTEKLHFFPLKM